jgi:hypothetical protein
MTRRLSKEMARVTGALKKNPKRYRHRPEPRGGPLGEAPGWMSPLQEAIWDSFRTEIPWLRRSDRPLIETATVLRERLRAADLNVASINQLRLILAALGSSPADRSKVTTIEENNDEKAEALARRYLQ